MSKDRRHKKDDDGKHMKKHTEKNEKNRKKLNKK